MCGIAGLLERDGRPADPTAVTAMTDIIAHRGPDDAGLHVDGPAALGHRRLSIIDLSPLGHQPMTNETGDVWLTFNGEIYNYLELIPELAARGHTFRSRSDSEVILHAYEEWGEACVERFNGIFAFAIWDARRRCLFCARDRFGVKPFYYRLDPRRFAFASEIKALLALDPAARAVDDAYLRHFLVTARFDDGPETCFAGILNLPPAHTLVVDADRCRLRRYWDVDPAADRAPLRGERAADAILELLTDAVRLQLRSDVPVGTCLSGGIDSSAIVALASRFAERPINTFSSVYDEPECDERPYMRLVNERFPTIPHLVRPRPDDLMPVLERIVWHQDEPTAGHGLYSQWHVMAEAHGKVKVLLDGQGSDELLGGYHHFFGPYLNDRVADTLAHPWRLRRLARDYRAIAAATGRAQVFAALRPHVPAPLQTLYRRLRHTESATDLHPDFLAGERVERAPSRVRGGALDRALYDATTSTSLPALLHYEDRNSMAFGIEARVPFLDHRFAELCLRLPDDEKIDGRVTKVALRRALRGIVPDPILDRTDKKGFPTPFGAWVRGPQRDAVRDVLLSPEARARRVFDPAAVARKLEEHTAGRYDHSWSIWRYLTTELWFRRFVDDVRPLPAAPARATT